MLSNLPTMENLQNASTNQPPLEPLYFVTIPKESHFMDGEDARGKMDSTLTNSGQLSAQVSQEINGGSQCINESNLSKHANLFCLHMHPWRVEPRAIFARKDSSQKLRRALQLNYYHILIDFSLIVKIAIDAALTIVILSPQVLVMDLSSPMGRGKGQ
ncbi:hypothetical protein FXO38_10888 [Capsicum annuum]|nr:hypothetical protein FXO37_22289 [Capsicum annuum]KAF3662931.1 hypothetical protein FXO38_10888 [Capsicum annuum]